MGHSQLRRMPSYLLTLLRTFLLISCEDGSNRWLDGHIRYEVRQGVNRRLGQGGTWSIEKSPLDLLAVLRA